MREILFKGKRFDGGGWVEGFYVHSRGLDYIYEPFKKEGSILEFKVHDILPSSIGQYTGLKSKDDKMIFEGDIITYNKETYTIIWDEHFCKFCKLAHNIKSNGIQQIFPLCQVESVKIIGTIFDKD